MASSKSKGNEDMTKAAGKMWEFLDKLATENPDEYKKFIDQQLEEGRNIMTPPEPAYCIQCQVRAWEVTCTLFVNVCKWIRVPKPADEDAPVPVRGGTLRYLTDERTKLKTASKDLVYDVAFNPAVIEECTPDAMLDGILMSLVLQFVEDQTDLRFIDKKSTRKIKALFKGPKVDLQHSLDEHWGHLLTPESKLDVGHSLLKQLKSLKTEDPPDPSSPLPPLILRPDNSKQQPTTNGSAKTTAQKKQLIEVISSEKSSGDVKKGGRLPTPAHSMVVKEPDGKYPVRTIVVKVTLSGVTSADQVDLEVSENDLQLSVDQRYQLSLPLPISVNDDTTKAKFTSKNSVLTITLPCL